MQAQDKIAAPERAMDPRGPVPQSPPYRPIEITPTPTPSPIVLVKDTLPVGFVFVMAAVTVILGVGLIVFVKSQSKK